MLTCAILIINWNGARLLEECLPSVVEAAAVAGAEVWVIDNASRDDSAAVCRARFPSVRFEALPDNNYLFSYNAVAARCKSDIILILNNDVVVERDFLPPLLAHFEREPETFAVTASIYTYPPGPDATLQAECTEVAWTYGMLRRGRLLEATCVRPVFYNCGCATAYDRLKFVELHGYDELYAPLYYEDIDLSWRAWKRGWTCLYEPQSRVYHMGGASAGRSERVETMILRNEFLFHWKNLDSPSLLMGHLFSTGPRLLTALVRRDRARLKAFGQALQRLGPMLRSRRRDARQFQLNDLEVIRKLRGNEAACLHEDAVS